MNTLRRIAPLFALLVVALVSLGCPPTTPTPTPPAPLPVSTQQQILEANKLLADTVNGAVKAAIQLRDQGKISQADNLTLQNYCAPAARFSDGLTVIVTSNEVWSVQRGKIIALVQATALPVIGANVSPVAAALVTQVGVLFDQIKRQVGL